MSNREDVRRYRETHIEALRAKQRLNYHTRPERRCLNWKKHGVRNADGTQFTVVDFDRAYQMQSGACKICGKHQSALKKALHVDHRHSDGVFRALLCNGCNIKVGVAENALFTAVLSYVRES